MARVIDVLRTGITGDVQEWRSRLAAGTTITASDEAADAVAMAIRTMVECGNRESPRRGDRLYQALRLSCYLPDTNGKVHRSLGDAAKSIGVADSTLRRRIRSAEEFIQAMLQRRGDRSVARERGSTV